jgi:hypothetical protein
MSNPLLHIILCIVCRKPVDLSTDLYADENGRAVHEECYVRRITSVRLACALAESFLLAVNLVPTQTHVSTL